MVNTILAFLTRNLRFIKYFILQKQIITILIMFIWMCLNALCSQVFPVSCKCDVNHVKKLCHSLIYGSINRISEMYPSWVAFILARSNAKEAVSPLPHTQSYGSTFLANHARILEPWLLEWSLVLKSKNPSFCPSYELCCQLVGEGPLFSGGICWMVL